MSVELYKKEIEYVLECVESSPVESDRNCKKV